MERKPPIDEKYDSVPLLSPTSGSFWPPIFVGSISSKPWTGVKASVEVMPLTGPPARFWFCRATFLAVFADSFIFCSLATMRSRPEPSLPSTPSPMTCRVSGGGFKGEGRGVTGELDGRVRRREAEGDKGGERSRA